MYLFELYKQQVTMLYMKNSYALLSFTDFAFFCFPTTTSFFPKGHPDMNATLTANSTRRTFQSPITTKNQTSKVLWPDAVSCPSSNPAARLSLPLLILSLFQTLSAMVRQRARPKQ